MKAFPIGAIDKSGRFIKTAEGWKPVPKKSKKNIIKKEIVVPAHPIKEVKKKTITSKEFFISKAIEISKVPNRSIEDYSNKELNKIAEAFSSSKMLELKSRFGEKEFLDALNSICFLENEEDTIEELEDAEFIEE